MAEILKGKCIGGPRDGVIVEADSRWHGVIKQPQKFAAGTLYYPGRYIWNYARNHWEWFPNINIKKPGRK